MEDHADLSLAASQANLAWAAWSVVRPDAATVRANRKTGGRRIAAAHLLGIGKTTLYRKLKQDSRQYFQGQSNRKEISE
jgi:transcriptional regulator of acetoin/glycerol metabolism